MSPFRHSKFSVRLLRAHDQRLSANSVVGSHRTCLTGFCAEVDVKRIQCYEETTSVFVCLLGHEFRVGPR